MKISSLRGVLLALSLFSIAYNASAGWVLNNAESKINFISIKKSKVGEVHTFGKMRGAVKDNGDVTVTISLASVETNIPIRNDRMKSMLFEIGRYPESTVSTKVNFTQISKMKTGETLTQPVKLKLSIHGEEKLLDADVRVVKLAGNKILVSTTKPIIVNAADFSLEKGIEMLRKVAKLPSISPVVPVTINLVFYLGTE